MCRSETLIPEKFIKGSLIPFIAYIDESNMGGKHVVIDAMTQQNIADDDCTVEELIEAEVYREVKEHPETTLQISIAAGKPPEDTSGIRDCTIDTREFFKVYNTDDGFLYEFESYVDEYYEFDHGDAKIPHKVVAEFLKEPVQFAIDEHGLEFDHGGAYEVTRCEVKDRGFVFGVLDELEELIDE